MLSKRFLLAFFFLLLVAMPVLAQDGDPATELQKELWCPICQGIRLDVCEQKVCQQMRDLIDEELAAGKSKEEIKQQFIEFYGPVVLGEPPRQGINWLAWIIPVLLAAGGLLFAGWMTRSWSRRVQSQVDVAPGADAPPDEDSYLSQVEREIEDL
ncbi:MAG: cytochrome c-type biogenesis protein CcmH [Chloroflexi bacterium]|nr:cytochrome c-type biogenesis protein CcmH [Chloroflexota bacterium]